MTTTAATRWDPRQYGRYGDLRLRPAMELLARVDHGAPRTVWDIGCGRGEIARVMAERWPTARVLGLDRSREMLDAAEAVEANVEGVEADVAGWTPDEPADVIYANAVLHWIAGHDSLFPRLMESLAPEGVLAVQMPLSWDQPSHQALRETLDEGFGPDELRRSVARRWVEEADWYYDLLRPLASYVDIWETRYLQILEGEDPVLEWVKGTALRPVMDALEGDELERFLEAFRARLAELYPRRPGGETLFPFARLFIVATR